MFKPLLYQRTNEHVYLPKTAERQTERQKKNSLHLQTIQANYNTQRTNDHKN